MSLYSSFFSAAHSDKLDTCQRWHFVQTSARSPDAEKVDHHVAHLSATTPPRYFPWEKKESPVDDDPKLEQKMTVKTYTWISLWFVLTTPVILWDATYCLFRPRSMLGGDLHWIWKPYAIYQEVDYVYGVKAFQDGSGFTNAQSILNIVETIINLIYVWQAHVSKSPSANIVGFGGAIMTFSKTALYWLQEYCCNFCAIGHNTAQDLILYWIIPNGLWLLVPGLIILRLGKDIVASLRVAQTASRKKAQ